ncbi:hypothetical protein CRUP_007575 [Coryphaenoides rupestris]|nr:hypothetical protein CRUP_007575 [Coryphaenoides rupestris]
MTRWRPVALAFLVLLQVTAVVLLLGWYTQVRPYKMVRYEDIALNILEEVNDIYKFVGLEMTTRVGEWIYKMTHGKESKGGTFKIISQNATYLSQAWRGTLDHAKPLDKASALLESLLSVQTLLLLTEN